MIRVVGALLRKEMLVELRTLESVPGMSLFAVTTFVVFHFALNRSVVLPAPLGPKTTSVWPSSSVSERSLSAARSP